MRYCLTKDQSGRLVAIIDDGSGARTYDRNLADDVDAWEAYL